MRSGTQRGVRAAKGLPMTVTVGIGIGIGIAAVLASPSPAAAQSSRYADLGVTISGPSSARVNQETTYELTVSNAGPGDAPAKVEFGYGDLVDSSGSSVIWYRLDVVSATSPQGTCQIKYTATCKLSHIAPGGTATMTVVIRAPDLLGDDLELLATVEVNEVGGASDTNSDNNHFEALVAIEKPIKIAGLPRGCASKSFVLKVKSTVVDAKRTKVIVDGKALASSAKPKLKAKVDLEKLRGTKHEVDVVVQDTSGPPLAKQGASFRTC